MQTSQYRRSAVTAGVTFAGHPPTNYPSVNLHSLRPETISLMNSGKLGFRIWGSVAENNIYMTEYYPRTQY